MQLRALILSLAAFAAMPTPHAAASEKIKPAFILVGEASTPPRGFVAMCERETSFCGPEGMNGTQQEKQAVEDFTTATIVETEDQAAFVMPLKHLATIEGAGLLPCCDAPLSAPKRDALYSEPKVSKGRNYDRLAEVVAVNRQVNARVKQVSDKQIYGVDEFWTRSTTGINARGDCEDLALEKRFKLVEAGFDPDRLFFAVVYNRDLGLHTVLVARLEDGDFVLDSRTPYVDRWYETSYSWVSIQSTKNPGLWFRPGQATQMAANTHLQKKSEPDVLF
jgi:predicted transglutaminase-like cysteine proteinase